MEFLPIVLVTLQPTQPGECGIIPLLQRPKAKAPRQSRGASLVS